MSERKQTACCAGPIETHAQKHSLLQSNGTDARRHWLHDWSLNDEASTNRSRDFGDVSSRHPDNEELGSRFEKTCLLSSATLTCETMTTSGTLGLARNQLAKAHSEEAYEPHV